MSRLLKITDLGSGIMVQGTDNVLYPDNATLTYPYNSIVVVTDESNIATFRSASNNDVLFSGLIGKIEIGGEIVTKENINVKFDEIANQESGGGGDVTGLFADASYDSQTKHINFYDKDNTLVAYVDATAFIKDGMVSNVEILNGNLVITFNTDSGKQPISIPLTDIFNPNEYYTKTEIDAKEQSVNASIALKANITDLNAETTARQDADTTLQNGLDSLALNLANEISNRQDADTTLQSNIDTKANIEDVYDKQTADSTFATQVVVNEEIASRIEAIREVNTALGTKADKSDTYTKAQVDDALALKQDASTAFSGDYDDLTNKPTIPDTNDFVTKAEYNPKERAIAEALTDLNENKADKTELPDVSTFATKTELNAKQDALVSGTNIKTINNQSILGEGNIEIQGGGGGMDEDTELLISSALVDLNDRKIDATEVKENYQKKGDYATNSKVDTKANISDVPTNEDYEEAQKITSWSLNDLNARFGGLKLEKISQSDYAALTTKDNNTLYIITTN